VTFPGGWGVNRVNHTAGWYFGELPNGGDGHAKVSSPSCRRCRPSRKVLLVSMFEWRRDQTCGPVQSAIATRPCQGDFSTDDCERGRQSGSRHIAFSARTVGRRPNGMLVAGPGYGQSQWNSTSQDTTVLVIPNIADAGVWHGPRGRPADPVDGPEQNPVNPRGFPAQPLDGCHPYRLRAFGPLADLELDSLILLKRAITVALDFRMVDEHVFRTAVRSDKAKTLFAVEPFNSSLCHANFSLFKWV